MKKENINSLFNWCVYVCLWQTHKFTPVICKESVAVLIKVLAYPKFHLDKFEIETVIAEFLPFAETCLSVSSRPEIPGLVDPDDAIFIWLAQEAKVDFIVSGDKHLLALKNSRLFPDILTLSEFIFRFEPPAPADSEAVL